MGRGPFTIDLGPDWLHKANVSGGPPYGMEVPNFGVDGLLLWEPHQTIFVNYLRSRSSGLDDQVRVGDSSKAGQRPSNRSLPRSQRLRENGYRFERHPGNARS